MMEVSGVNSSLYKRLVSLNYYPSNLLCLRDRLSIKEDRTTYILALDDKLKTVSFQIDGYIICDGLKCDHLILIQNAGNQWCEIFVELKGTDVNHAIEQLESTISREPFAQTSSSHKKARIVAQSFPSNKSNPIVEKAKRRFLNKYRCELKSVKSLQPDRINFR